MIDILPEKCDSEDRILKRTREPGVAISSAGQPVHDREGAAANALRANDLAHSGQLPAGPSALA
ncbi:hypothetical protein [Micromonospora taraxaci]